MIDTQFNNREVKDLQAKYGMSDEDLAVLMNYAGDFMDWLGEDIEQAEFCWNYDEDEDIVEAWINNEEDDNDSLTDEVADIIKKYKLMYATVTLYNKYEPDELDEDALLDKLAALMIS